MSKIGKKRIARRRIGPPVAKRKLPWWLKRLENPGEVNRVQVDAMRRQVKADGYLKMVKVWLVKDKDRKGRWIIRLKGGMTGREYLRAERCAGDCFFRLRLHGWTVHEGRLGDDPENDFFWIPGGEIVEALKDFGWL